MAEKIKFVEVCSGCGGLSLGFLNKGFECILLNDINKNCIKTLKENHNVEVYEKCFTEIEWDKHKNLDLLIGGVPCQAFSQAGNKKGLNDKRGNLIIKFIEIVNNIKPKVFVIENVKGLKMHNKGETLKHILSKIDKNYKVYVKVLNANDYSVPQKRERLFIVGVSNKINKIFDFPKEHSYKPVLKDVLNNITETEGFSYNEKKLELFKKIPQGGCWINLPEELQKEYLGKSYNSGGGKRGILKRLDMNKPSLTLLTSPSQKQTERCHPLETRPLNIREYARIQTFPDSYKFSGCTSQKYLQIGNAVPVKLAEALALEIKKLFE